MPFQWNLSRAWWCYTTCCHHFENIFALKNTLMIQSTLDQISRFLEEQLVHSLFLFN
jgi:hypothetical protein